MDIKNTNNLSSDKIKMLIYGNSGIGKTSLAKTLDHTKTLIVSAESGLLCLDDVSIDVIEVKTYDEIISVYVELIKENSRLAKYENIFIDSLTEVSANLVAKLENLPEYQSANMGLKMWGEYNKRITKLIKSFRDLDKNVIFTALSEDVDDGGFLIKKALIKGSATQKLLESYFDEVFFYKVEENNQGGSRVLATQPANNFNAKDRSGKLEAKEEPNLQNIILKIKGIKV